MSFFQNITIQGLYDDQTGNPLFGVIGAAIPLQGSPATGSGLVIAGYGTDGFIHALSLGPNGFLNVNATVSIATVTGNLSNNTAAPIADNLGVLSAVANAANPTYIEGNQVLLSVDLSGHIRSTDKANNTTGTAVGTTVELVGARDTVGNAQPIKSTTAGTVISISADQAEASSLSYFSYDNANVFITSSGGVAKALWSIRANSASITFLLRELQWFTNGVSARFQLLKNTTLTGATFAATSPSANVQVDTAATSFSGGTVVMSGYVGITPRSFDTLLTAMASGAPGDTFTMVGQGFGTGSASLAAQIRWSEASVIL